MTEFLAAVGILLLIILPAWTFALWRERQDLDQEWRALTDEMVEHDMRVRRETAELNARRLALSRMGDA